MWEHLGAFPVSSPVYHFYTELCSFPRIVITKSHKLGAEIYPLLALETRHLRSDVDRATLPPQQVPGEGPSCLFQLPGAPLAPWLMAACLPSLSPLSHGLPSVCVCVSIFFLSGHQSYWIRTHPDAPILIFSHLQRAYVQIRPPPHAPGIRTSPCLFGGHNSTHKKR